MKKILFVTLFFILQTIVSGQEYKQRMFDELDSLVKSARENDAQLLSPGLYERGIESYKEAEEALKNGDNLEDVTEAINLSKGFFSVALQKSDISRNTFINALKAREDAMNVSAPKLVEEMWTEAEERFRSATLEVEDNEMADARELGFESEKLYRNAELNAIKITHLQNVWDLIEKADDESVESFAPKTVEKAKIMAENAEEEIQSDRYDTRYADQLIAQAEYELNHGFVIMDKIKEIEEKDISYEDLLLSLEQPMINAGKQINHIVRFDKGYKEADNALIEALKNYSDSTHSLAVQNEELHSEILQYEVKLGNINEEQLQLREKVEEIEEFKRKVKEIEEMFLPGEAEVIYDAEKVTIRLISLKFSVGSSMITPQYFSLLTKVQKSIRQFEGAAVTVEGHTDSRGREEVNSELSQKRADAVMQYLKANMPDNKGSIYAIGYGEARPIANNETEEGREQNRRIDIVINPIL